MYGKEHIYGESEVTGWERAARHERLMAEASLHLIVFLIALKGQINMVKGQNIVTLYSLKCVCSLIYAGKCVQWKNIGQILIALYRATQNKVLKSEIIKRNKIYHKLHFKVNEFYEINDWSALIGRSENE